MDLLNLRSMLFVPTLQERFVQSALRSQADAIILDLEDSIAPAEKARARAQLVTACRVLTEGGRRVFVRVNSAPATDLLLDLAEVARSGAEGVLVPKTESAALIQHVTAATASQRPSNAAPLRIVPLIETPLGLLNVASIAVQPQVAALAFGTEDYAISIGSDPVEEAMFAPAQQMALAARAHGLAALGVPGSIAIVDDEARFARMARTARLIGMTGILCIHPRQVGLANAAFTPSSDDVEEAQGIKAAFEEVAAAGHGATRYRGQMIDLPHYNKALRVLETARRYALV